MAKDPAFLFYTGDFTTGTQFFNDEQVGIFIRLMMAQHQHGRLSEKQVKIINKTSDFEVMQKFKKDEQGFFYNERLEIEINKRKAFSESRSNNKKGKTKSLNNEVIITKKTSDIHMEDENKDEDKIINFIHCDKKFLFEKIEKFNQQQQTEIENLFQLYFCEAVKKEHPKSAVQQQIIFDLMPMDFSFEELKKNINEAIAANYKTIFWKKEKNFAPKKENERENLKDKIYDTSI
jgi:hypothetical protein